MQTDFGWGEDLVSSSSAGSGIALETFENHLTQSAGGTLPCPFFKPINIIVENGLYYANIHVCKASNGTPQSQQLNIWLSTLKEVDHVHLTVSSTLLDVPLLAVSDLMTGLYNTKALIDIHLDQIVSDTLAYFYLAAGKITKGYAGALWIPSYADQRAQDTSGPWRAMIDFYRVIVENAVTKNVLTREEADKLHGGSAVAIPSDRFA